jgi:phospho-N-acetylmuramoyl-pentapeptide-transferase
MTGLGLVGFLDDFIKISGNAASASRSKQKLLGQALVAIIFAILALQFPGRG